MGILSIQPFIEVLPVAELRDRLDLNFYRPELRKISHEIENLPDIQPLENLLLDEYPISSGATPSGAEYLDEGIPFLRVQNVRPMSVNLDDVVFISDETHEVLKRSEIINGDVLLTITGATFGYAGVFRSEEYEFANVNQHIVRIRVDESKAIPEFVAFFLNSRIGYGQSLRYSTGGSRPALDFGSIRSFSFPLVEKNEEQIHILESREIVNMHIGKLLHKANFYRNRRSALPDELDLIFSDNFDHLNCTSKTEWVESKDPLCMIHTNDRSIGVVPFVRDFDRLDARYYMPCRLRELVNANTKAWGVLSDYVEISRESYVSEGKLSHIAIDKMPDDPWASFEINEGYVGPTTYLEKGDIAISRLMPTIMNGKCFLAWETVTGSPEFIRIRASKDYQAALLFWMKTRYVREYLLANVRGSSASQKRFTEDDLAACPVPKVLFENPKSIIDACGQLLAKANEAAQKASKLEELSIQLTNRVKDNIFALLNLTFIAEMEKTVEEALQ